MSLVINNNLMAMNAAKNLNDSYNRLSVSTRRLSSGLRVGTAADDAAGLAIRELMRADIASLNQGVRNANDAISMIQVADGALGVIDEKLIRMKELAEQASTGTYNPTQRMLIDSEYQAMASEITRIANATDFNGIKLLDGSLSNPNHDGSGIESKGKIKIHFGPGNSSAEDYYYIQIDEVTAQALGVGNSTNYSNLMKRAKEDAVNAMSLDFAALKNGTAEEKAAYQRALAGVDKFFADLDGKVQDIFSPPIAADAATNYNDLFAAVDVGAAADSVELQQDLNKTRIYGSRQELDEAANKLYKDLAKDETFSGVNPANGTFADAATNACAMSYVAALYDNAVIAAEGGSIPKDMTIDSFNSLPDAQKEALKASVAMAFMNSMVNGSQTMMQAQTIDLNNNGVGLGGATDSLGLLNNMNPDGTQGVPPTGNALTTDSLTDAQFYNLVRKFDYGYSQATAGNVTDPPLTFATDTDRVDYITQMNNGTTTGTNTGDLLTGISSILKDIGANPVGGYKQGTAPTNANTSINDMYGAIIPPNPALSTGFSRPGLDTQSFQFAYAHTLTNSTTNTAKTRSLAGNNIQTQEGAQQALEALNDAIVKKDNVRANLGSMQNRLENTITNLETQAENLQAAESRISDVDVATEMTEFVRNQILTQSAVAMLTQANSLPKMAMQLIGG